MPEARRRLEQTRLMDDGTVVVVRRSARRKRSVSAFWEAGTVVVAIPASFSRAEEEEWTTRMVARLLTKDRRKPGAASHDTDLAERARRLSERYLQGLAVPSVVRWVSNQKGRWGSATPADKTIRLSDKLQGMPEWVVDYVLVHELSHLLAAGHGPDFWAWCDRYPRSAEAKAFLQGVAYAQSRGLDVTE